MILSYIDIKKAIEKKKIVIDPYDPRSFREASYILHLGRGQIHAKKKNSQIDISFSNSIKDAFSERTESDSLVLKPGKFVLVNTLEKITIPLSHAGFITPLSHISRWGIDVTKSSFLVNPGFGLTKATSLTLELTSHNPNELIIPTGTPICHLIFTALKSRINSKKRFKSLYEGKSSPSVSQLSREFNTLKRGKAD